MNEPKEQAKQILSETATDIGETVVELGAEGVLLAVGETAADAAGDLLSGIFEAIN